MRRWHGSSLFGALALVLAAAAPAHAASCDENDPLGPSAHTQITLGPADATDAAHDELRTFIATGSLGKVTATIVAADPKDIVRSFGAAAELSRASPLYGEALKGIAVRVTLKRGDRSASVAVSLNQVCAQYFKDTFLYY